MFCLLLAACGSKSSDTSAGSGTASNAPVPATTGTKLFVDDKEVASVDAAKVASWPRLDSLLPENARRLGKWQAISIKNAKPTPPEIANPSQAYHDYIPALFPGPDGKVSFGMFDPVELGKHGKAALQEDGVLELRVKLAADSGRGENDHGGGSATDPQNIKLAIVTPKGEQTMTGDKLLAIPREGMPGGGGDAKGWRLGAILDAAGIKTFKKVRLTDAAGPSLTLEAGDLDAKTIPFIKLNRQGSLRFRVYKQQGEGWQPAGDLRDLSKIEVLE
jgi:hypothetical protein